MPESPEYERGYVIETVAWGWCWEDGEHRSDLIGY